MDVRGEKVVVVEDDPLIREILRMHFEDRGATVFGAADGYDALRILEREAGASLVVTDVLMPGMEGISLIFSLRKRYPGMKVIAVSGGGFMSGADYLATASQIADRILLKPFEPSHLDELVASL